MKLHMKHLLTVPLLLMFITIPAGAQEAGVGTVTGIVYDASTGTPVPQVTVSVAEMPEKTSVTTIDGMFKLELPPGTYSLKLSEAKYMDGGVTDVVVAAGEVVDASTVMVLASKVTSIDVVESITVETATAESIIAERKLSESVSDAISAQEIKASTASDAAGALQKVTGVSVSEGKFVYVRGLGERYSATRLNNAMVATTEPEKRVVPLDLFPANLIDNIAVKKSYTPDLPGEFSAGLVQIKTTDFPTQKILSVSFSTGFNTQTTGKNFLRYPGGGTDFWGFDDGTRGLPGAIPSDTRVDRFNFNPQELQEFGRSLPVNWEPAVDSSARPTLDWSVVAGGTRGKLGVVGAFSFSNDLKTIPDQVRNFYVPNPDGPEAGAPLLQNSFDYMDSTTAVRMGGILNAAYQVNPANKLTIRNFLSRDTDNSTRSYEGFYEEWGTDVRNARLRWVERTLYSVQGGGEHLLQKLGNSIVNWQLGYSKAVRDEPDLRENLYLYNPIVDDYEFFDDSQSAFRMFNDQDEDIWNPQVNWLTPFYKSGLSGSFKFGVDYAQRRRRFGSRRLRFGLRGSQGIDPTLPPNDLLASENIRPDGFELAETTRITDSYDGERDVWGGYGMVDISLSPKWRVIGGLRVENVDQNVITFDQFNPEREGLQSPYNETNVLPGVNVVYYLTSKQNLRFGVSQTVSRPDFRELALFDFTDITGGRQTIGNPDLVQTKIRNFDGRWEYFPGGNQLIAASFFYKTFRDPIERTIIATVGLLTTYDNAEDANNYGFELEYRRSMDVISEKLREFAVSANYTFVDSTIDLSNVEDRVLTSEIRPMQGQSRHVANIVGEWARPKWRSTARFYFNHFSGRITDVGAFGLPDVIQEGVTTLDFVYEFDITEGGKWKIRFGAQNLSDPQYLWTQGGSVFQSWHLGRSFKVGTSVNIF